MQRKERVDCRRVESVARRALSKLGMEQGELSVVLVSDRRIRELNRNYRGVDSSTDVLAFSQAEGAGPRQQGLLGDVVISAETAARQAGSRKSTLARELDLLVVHGVLHLAGMDHLGTEEQKKEMSSWQRRILRGWDG